ncbi:MAG TPA: hypothetical protein VGX68_24285 [Thermoanaerobaculia bacterium]|nr:hypothetical protein [Thermoanaerobaculia bacterium]
MSKKWVLVNVALLGLAGLLAWQLEVAVNRFKAANDLGKLPPPAPRPRTASDAAPPPPLQAPSRYNAGDFGVVPAQNLFSDLRGKPEEEPKPAATEAPALAVKPILVGVTISPTQRLASIIDPSTPGQGAARRTQTRRLGDVYQGYTIVDIAENQMVLANGSRTEIIPLFDSTKQAAKGGRTPTQAARVVAFGAAASAAGGQASVATNRPQAAGAQPPPGAATAVGQPASVNPQPSVRTVVTPAQAQQQARQVPGNAPQPQLAPNERIDEQGRRIIRTPFGDIVRDKPNN